MGVFPCVIEGLAGFPVPPGNAGGRNDLLGGLKVSLEAPAEAIVHHDVGLQFLGQFNQTPCSTGVDHSARDVEPENRYLAITGKEFIDLWQDQLVEIALWGPALFGMVPVEVLRIVETHFQPAGSAGIRQLPDPIALGWGVGDFKIGVL